MSEVLERNDLCPVCNGAQLRTWRWPGLDQCQDCGYVRKSLAAGSESIEAIQNAYFDAGFVAQDDVFTTFHERLNCRRRLREVRTVLTEGKALEIGVGRGNLLMTLKAAGYDVVGLDLSPAVCEQVQARYGMAVRCGTLESHANETPAESYDVILMCHVLEHLDSLPRALGAIRRLLKVKGILYVAVPNVSSWNAGLPGWTGYEPYHRHYFRPATLRRVLKTAGFEVKFEKTSEPISGWFNAITRSARNHVPDLEAVPQPESNDHNGALWLTYNVLRIATGAVTSPIRWLQSGLGYGEELIMIAQPAGVGNSDNGRNR